MADLADRIANLVTAWEGLVDTAANELLDEHGFTHTDQARVIVLTEQATVANCVRRAINCLAADVWYLAECLIELDKAEVRHKRVAVPSTSRRELRPYVDMIWYRSQQISKARQLVHGSWQYAEDALAQAHKLGIGKRLDLGSKIRVELRGLVRPSIPKQMRLF